MMPISTLDTRSRCQGTILLALTMYLVTGLILWYLAIPSTNLFARPNLTGHPSGDSLEQHLEYARRQAIERQHPISVCGSVNGQECAGGNHWTDGWIVFADPDLRPGQISGDDKLLYAHVIKPRGSSLSIEANYVRYLANGEIQLD